MARNGQPVFQCPHPELDPAAVGWGIGGHWGILIPFPPEVLF